MNPNTEIYDLSPMIRIISTLVVRLEHEVRLSCKIDRTKIYKICIFIAI